MRVRLYSKSSSGGPYNVDFFNEDGKLTIFCNCKAGEMNQLCKHRLAFIRGDESMLHNSQQKDELRKALNWTRKTNLDQFFKQIEENELRIESLKKSITKLKKDFARRMKDGFDIK